MQNSTLSKKGKYILAAVAAFLIFSVLWLVSNRGNNIDVVPEEATSTDYSTQARIVNGEDLLKQLGGVAQSDYLSVDLLVFGRKNFSAYKDNTKKIVGFEVTSKITKKGNKVEFEGKYGASGHKISVAVDVLKNSRIHTSITDKNAKANMDKELPSNTNRNKLIGSLPVQKSTYSVDYVAASDSFLINLFEDGPENKAAAENFLMSGLATSDLSHEKYQILIPASAGGGSPVEQ